MYSLIKPLLLCRTPSGALRIALGYVALGLLWITFSDDAVARFVGDRALANAISIGKGYAYVLITGALLYIAIRGLHSRQRRTQQQLARSERAYRTMFDNNPNPMFVYDASTLQFLAVNRAAISAYGYTDAEFLSKTLRDIYAESAQAELQRAIDAQEYSSDFMQLSTVTHQTKAKRLLTVELTISTLRMQGRAAQLLMAQDISQRVRVEHKLLESRRQLKEAQRIAGFGSWSLDYTSGALTVSEQMQRLLNSADSAETWTLQTLLSYVHPDDRAAAQLAFDNAWRRQPLQSELRLLRGDGEVYHVLIRGEQVTHGDGSGQLVGTILDINERKRHEKKLEDSERQYRQLIDNLPEAVLIHRDLQIMFANPLAVELFGGPLLGLHVDTLIAAPSHSEAYLRLEWLQGGLNRIDNRFHERLLRKANGEVFAAEVAARSIAIDGVQCIQVMVRDIGEQKKSQHELQIANERLMHLSTQMIEHAEAERRHLSRDLHDDLGQSLTFIKMTAAWLRKRLEHDECGERVAQLHVVAGEALEKVRNLSQALRPAQLDTLGLKAAMEEHLRKFCDGGGIGYKAMLDELEPRPDPLLEIALFRIFQEALTNIFRHSAASFIGIELVRIGAVITLRVIDDGHGFDVEAALARGGSLGLHTMQERAQQFGGQVQWQSVIGAGTEITAIVPAYP
jgi:PAS domain S-box-containing protein